MRGPELDVAKDGVLSLFASRSIEVSRLVGDVSDYDVIGVFQTVTGWAIFLEYCETEQIRIDIAHLKSGPTEESVR